MPPRINPRLGAFAQTMRLEPTPFERALWRELSASRLDGLKFRRQSVIGDIIADFYCPSAALIVEIDGNTHDVDRDANRDAALAHRGLKTLRFSNRDIADNLEGVLRTIVAECRPRRRDGAGSPPSEREGLGVGESGQIVGFAASDSPTPSPSLKREGSF